MATFLNLPGVRIQEVRLGAPPIAGVGTSTAGFVGVAPTIPMPLASPPLGSPPGSEPARFLNIPRLVTSADQFLADYVRDHLPDGTVVMDDETRGAQVRTKLFDAVLGFFQNGGTECYVVNVSSEEPSAINAGIDLLEAKEEIDIIAAPGITDKSVYKRLQDQAERTANRFAILDPPVKVSDIEEIRLPAKQRPEDSIWSAFYYPRIQISPVLKGDKDEAKAKPDKKFWAAPSGHIAGVYARVDGKRGVHKAPASERLFGALSVEHLITDSEQNTLNADGVNIIRAFSEGSVVWGARTVLNKDAGDKTFLYINVRRLTTFIEQSLRIGLRFAVFEPNNLALRQTITRSVRGFLDGVWRDGALFGATADEAYYVRFPEIFNRDEDRALGKLTIEIGIRVSYPAEFIIIRIGLLLQSANTA